MKFEDSGTNGYEGIVQKQMLTFKANVTFTFDPVTLKQ